jgi:hypothetical protein
MRRWYLAIMGGVDRCIHPEPGYRTPGPTLLIVGQHDKTGNIPKAMAAWGQREPAAEYHMIDGAGHCANLDRPEQVNTLITGFLTRHLDPGRADASGSTQVGLHSRGTGRGGHADSGLDQGSHYTVMAVCGCAEREPDHGTAL